MRGFCGGLDSATSFRGTSGMTHFGNPFLQCMTSVCNIMSLPTTLPPEYRGELVCVCVWVWGLDAYGNPLLYFVQNNGQGAL